MRARLFVWLLVSLAAGCTAISRPTIPVPTAIRFPSTWTPAPTATAAPPPPTATLVIQSTPGGSNAISGSVRRYPYPAYNTIGVWVDTTLMSSQVLRSLASRVELATGPQASAVRQANSRVISLERLNSATQPDNTVPSARALDSAYDGVLLEQVGMGVSSDPFRNSDQLLASVRSALDKHLLIADTYAWTDGAAYEGHSSDVALLVGRVDGVCLCNFLHSTGAPLTIFKSETEWKKDVDALAALSSYPNLVTLVATRFDQVSDQFLDQLQPWFDYALASFLIGENSSYAYFSFQGPHASDYMAGTELNTPLGNPVGGYYPSYGMYARHFQHGLVVVNAGDSVREMPLARLYATTLGDKVTIIRLEPHSGKILLFSP